MGGVGGRSLGDSNDAVLKGTDVVLGLLIDLLGGTAAGTGHIGILPELKQVVAELIVCHTCIPGTVGGIGVTVVGRGDDIEQGVVAQAGVGLSGGEGVDTVLQGNLCDQFFGIVVSCGVPVQDVNEPVAVSPGFVGGAGFCFSLNGLCLCCEVGGQQSQDHGQGNHEGQHSLQIFHNSLHKKHCVYFFGL